MTRGTIARVRGYSCKRCGIGVIGCGGMGDLCNRCLLPSAQEALTAFGGLDRERAPYVPGTLAEQMEAAVRRVIADLDRLP
jgi:hypothetical protein